MQLGILFDTFNDKFISLWAITYGLLGRSFKGIFFFEAEENNF